MSPRAPTSVSNLQQPGTPIDHLLDKNTPAPTPTDQHDNKSITASPYIQPAPSVEAPPSVEGVPGSNACTMDPSSVGPPTNIGPCTPTLQQQPQQQCGSISVKKFDVQPGTPLLLGSNNNCAASAITATAMDMKLEPGSMPNMTTTLPNNINRNNSITSVTNAMHDFLNLYKPPKVTVKDIDTFANEDCLKLDVLYDFTVQDAW